MRNGHREGEGAGGADARGDEPLAGCNEWAASVDG